MDEDLPKLGAMSGIPTMFRNSQHQWRRWLFGGLVTATGLLGARMMTDIMSDDGITALEILILVLFTVTFSWIAIPFWNAAIGFILTTLHRDPLSLG